jgi:hypothetical protein
MTTLLLLLLAVLIVANAYYVGRVIRGDGYGDHAPWHRPPTSHFRDPDPRYS